MGFIRERRVGSRRSIGVSESARRERAVERIFSGVKAREKCWLEEFS
jgi:hypothetical protein